MDMQKQIKQSNIELLRIVAMLMIVLHHFCVHGIFPYWHNNSTTLDYINNVIVSIFYCGGKLGVDIFVLITGYFMINSSFKLKKALNIYLQTFIYSILFLIIAYIYNDHHVPSKILNSSLFPFGGNAYWFITTYLMLYLLTPCLNHFIKTASKNTLNSLLLITTIFWVIIPTFTHGDYAFSKLLWFIYLYFIGAAIKTKSFANILNNYKLFKNLSITSLVFWISFALIKCLKTNLNLYNICKPADLNTIFTLSIAIFLFLLFKNMNIKENKLINTVSTSVLGVYLFHDNDIVRPFLWKNILDVSNYMNSPYLILIMIFCCTCIFIIGIFLDKIIKLIFNKTITQICNKIEKLNLLKNY